MNSKLKTGIKGLDSVLHGGYPKGKSTLIKGGPGTGKSFFCYLFAKQSLESGYHVTFISSEESEAFTLEKMAALDINHRMAIKQKRLNIIDLSPNFSDTVSGMFEIDAILLRVQASIKTKKSIIIIDSLQNMFLLLKDERHVMSLLRLLNWCREQSLTLLATVAESGLNESIQYFEEYASDCVVKINQTITNKLMTRYLRILKLRGSGHGSNEYPFLIHAKNISILPITDNLLEGMPSSKRFKTGIESLDKMLGGGYFSSSIIMVSGSSGTAKSLLLATFAEKMAKGNKKVLYISFEESPDAFVHRIRSANIHFEPMMKKNGLHFHGRRSCEFGLEEHLIKINDLYDSFKPHLLIIDPISALLDLGSSLELKSLIIRFIGHLQKDMVTVAFSELLKEKSEYKSDMGISSLSDTWIRLNYEESDGELYRTIHVIKSRGSKTSNQIKEFKISDRGLNIVSPYLGGGGLVFGSKKAEKELLDQQHIHMLIQKIKKLNEFISRIKKIEYSPYDVNFLRQLEIMENLIGQKADAERELKDIKIRYISSKSSREN